MKYKLIAALLLCTLGAGAQDEEGMRKIETARIALITERLNLTPEQAEKFWPLYKEYTQQRHQLRHELRSLRRTADGKALTEEQSKEVIQKGLALKQRQVELDQTYTGKLSGIITSQQVLQLRSAEDEFREMIIKRLENRREDRERIERRIERKAND